MTGKHGGTAAGSSDVHQQVAAGNVPHTQLPIPAGGQPRAVRRKSDRYEILVFIPNQAFPFRPSRSHTRTVWSGPTDATRFPSGENVKSEIDFYPPAWRNRRLLKRLTTPSGKASPKRSTASVAALSGANGYELGSTESFWCSDGAAFESCLRPRITLIA